MILFFCRLNKSSPFGGRFPHSDSDEILSLYGVKLSGPFFQKECSSNKKPMMIRGYAIGFSNLMAIFGLILAQLLPFENRELAKLMGLGGPLLFNIIMAEWLIRWKLAPSIS